SLALDTRLGWRENVLSGRVEANAGGVRSGGVSLGLLGVEGLVKARNGFDKAEFRGSLEGEGVRQGAAFDRALADAQAASVDTLLGRMLAQMRSALKREERGSRLSGEIALRRNGAEGMALVIPQAELVGGSGAALLTLSRFQAITGAEKQPPRLAGNFTTGGAGMPRISGRMERGRAGQALFRLTMAPWRAQGGSLAIPEMMVAQVADGSIGFAGTAQVSGAIPGGSVQNLVLPVNGAYGARGEFEKAGLDVEVVSTRGGSETVQAVIVGGMDVAYSPGVNAVLAAAKQSNKFKIIS
ncbi:MAG: hypothetical protein V4521_12775, partial [Pseudomonadota bacterium]